MIKFRRKYTQFIIANFILLLLFPSYSFAQIDYISLHEVESAKSEALSLKLNIVEKDPALPLKFILSNQQIRTTLSSERINDYMIKLKGPSNVNDRAVINVYQLEKEVWRRVKGIRLSGSLAPLTPSDETETITRMNNKDNNASTVKVTTTTQITNSKPNCILTRQPNETLWGIASRYKKNRQLDIYSTMIAIYNSNLTKFSKQHISQLMDITTLNCPSDELIDEMGTKTQMEAEFNRLNALPLK